MRPNDLTPIRPTAPRRGRRALLRAACWVTLLAGCAGANHDPSQHAGPAAPGATGAQAAHAAHVDHADPAADSDTREAVRFPEPLRTRTLAHMRDHLLAVAEIQGHLGRSEFERAAEVAEQRLGLSSLRLHGAHEVARFMPAGMQAAGTAMHRSASRFALVAQEASASGDPRPPQAALAELVQTCVACHAAYRLP